MAFAVTATIGVRVTGLQLRCRMAWVASMRHLRHLDIHKHDVQVDLSQAARLRH